MSRQVIVTARRFACGEVNDQSKRFAPSTAERCAELRRPTSRPRVATPAGGRAPLLARLERCGSGTHESGCSTTSGMRSFASCRGEGQIPVGATLRGGVGGSLWGEARPLTSKAYSEHNKNSRI
jgi:hypothetical protein